MKFLTDVNASGASAQWLRHLGHDVTKVSDRDPRMPDEEILKWAVEEGRIISEDDKHYQVFPSTMRRAENTSDLVGVYQS
jgi:predicted nuclease of predicted toxin-antitoxin system